LYWEKNKLNRIIMKKTLLFLFALVVCILTTKAQNDLTKSDDLARISLTPVVPEQMDGMPENALSVLENKLQQIATVNGLGASDYNPRFIITCKVVLVTKDIIPGPPAMHAYNMDMTMYIVDYFSKNVFSTTTVPVKGVGTNENKAYINGISNINANSNQFKSFIEKGKQKIIEYYNSRCDFIIKEALTMSSTDRYREAIYNLMSIPDVCKECFDKAMNEVPAVYKRFIDYVCNQNLAAAKAVWVANPNYEGANAVAGYLADIYPDASCYGDAQKLINEIRKKILKDENRNWNFMLKVWNDNVSLESQRIKAMRDIGVAWGNNQPQIIYDVNWIIH
jgi:hypothetical protein